MNAGNSCTVKRPRRGLVALRLLLIYIITAATLLLTFNYVPGLGNINNYSSAIWVILVISALEMAVWPLLIRFLLQLFHNVPPLLTLIAFSLISLTVPAFFILAASWLTPGLVISGFGPALVIAMLTTLISMVLGGFIAKGGESLFFQWLLRSSRVPASGTGVKKPGLIFLTIDGLSGKTLRQAMASGKAPNMKRWLDCGSHKVLVWNSDLSSQSSAAEAGMLHGNNFNIPGFRWYDKADQKVIISASVRDVNRLENSITNGNGLLARGGAARASLFTGDASLVLLTASRAFSPSSNDPGGYYAYYVNPSSMFRSLLSMFWEWVLEKKAAWGQWLRNMKPRVGRGGLYFLQRSLVTVLVRDITLAALRGDMYAGVPYAYATLAGYDEVAHRSGMSQHDTMEVLRKIDREFGRLEKASLDGARQYKFIVLSDHGQSPGATFKERYGQSLVEVVTSLVAGGGKSNRISENIGGHTGTYYLSATLRDYGLKNTQILERLEQHYDRTTYRVGNQEDSDIVVLASGNMGHITFKYPARRLTLEEIEFKAPGLVPGLVAHPGIGLAMVHSGPKGTLVMGKKGILNLSSGKINGEDPAAEYGNFTRTNLARFDSFPSAPDILVMSRYWPASGEVASFQDFVASHGGAGGEQSRPFVLYPSDFPLEKEEIVGAEEVYKIFKSWTEAVEHT